jgi:hypothetical protein
MAKIAIFLDAEAARFSPAERLVVPEAASVEADVSPNRAHIAQHGRSHGPRSFGQHRVVLFKPVRVLDCSQSCQSANFRALACAAYASKFSYVPDIQHVLRLKEFLP